MNNDETLLHLIKLSPAITNLRGEEAGDDQLETVAVRVGEHGRLQRGAGPQLGPDLRREDGHVDDQAEQQQQAFRILVPSLLLLLQSRSGDK